MPDAITCEACHASAPRRGPMQRYCEPCSERRDLERKRLWARMHPDAPNVLHRKVAWSRRKQEHAREAGLQVNARDRMSIAWDGRTGPDLLWQAGVSVPFSYAASKNHIYALRWQGHVALRREARAKREEIAIRLRSALRDQRVAHNKVWLDILVQKPDHRGDAVNVVDLVCDAVKRAVPVDDRWFCIRRLDWEIVKRDPRLFVFVGQESEEDCQVCSFCGRIRGVGEFNRKTGNPLGIDRVCRDCRRQGRRMAAGGGA